MTVCIWNVSANASRVTDQWTAIGSLFKSGIWVYTCTYTQYILGFKSDICTSYFSEIKHLSNSITAAMSTSLTCVGVVAVISIWWMCIFFRLKCVTSDQNCSLSDFFSIKNECWYIIKTLLPVLMSLNGYWLEHVSVVVLKKKRQMRQHTRSTLLIGQESPGAGNKNGPCDVCVCACVRARASWSSMSSTQSSTRCKSWYSTYALDADWRYAAIQLLFITFKREHLICPYRLSQQDLSRCSAPGRTAFQKLLSQ